MKMNNTMINGGHSSKSIQRINVEFALGHKKKFAVFSLSDLNGDIIWFCLFVEFGCTLMSSNDQNKKINEIKDIIAHVERSISSFVDGETNEGPTRRDDEWLEM